MASTLSVCVFCSSSEAVDQRARAVATDLGGAIARYGWRLVYGGGNVGLMGDVARAALTGGGHVTGVIPRRLMEREVAMLEADELILVDTMRERKQIMDERADAFVVLPGGIGTLEELMEVMTLKQLGFHDRPIALLDADGFWEPLRRQLERIVGARLAEPDMLDLVEVTTDVEQTLALVGAAAGDGRPHRVEEAGRADEPARPQG